MRTRLGDKIADGMEKEIYISKEEKDNNKEIVAKRLGELMGDKTIVEFANMVGLSDKVVYSYFTGYRFPTGHALKRIAERCGVTTDWILGSGE